MAPGSPPQHFRPIFAYTLAMPRLTNAQAKALKFDFTETCPHCKAVLRPGQYSYPNNTHIHCSLCQKKWEHGKKRSQCLGDMLGLQK